MNQKIDDALRHIENFDIEDILNQFNIQLIHASEMNINKMDSLLKVFHHRSVIFIKTDLEEQYRKFILYHEIGHYLLHYEEGMKFSFYLSRYKNRLEIEANNFACRCLLHDENWENLDIIDTLSRKGVPYKIAVQFYDMMEKSKLIKNL